MEILTPWGPPVEERPRILTEVERLQKHVEKREMKLERRKKRLEGGEDMEEVRNQAMSKSLRDHEFKH